MKFNNYLIKVSDEINSVLNKLNNSEIQRLLDTITNANIIVCAGAGRVGLAAKGFSMRLGHLGFKSYCVGDSTLPHLGKNDLLIVCSGSGETKSIVALTEVAKQNNMTIFLISGPSKSTIGLVSDYVLSFNVPTKNSDLEDSIQPMTTLNEQCLQIFFDTIVLLLMDKLCLNKTSLWNNHTNLE